ncbi:hypothetical protein [Xanthomonas sp. WHRI 7945]|nr:hypothetical protein [Xanthomonas campestris pv. campestris]
MIALIRTRVSRAAFGTPMECLELRCSLIGSAAGALAPSAAAGGSVAAPVAAPGCGHLAVPGSVLPHLQPVLIDRSRPPTQQTPSAALRRIPPMHAMPNRRRRHPLAAHRRTPPIHP